MPYMNKLPMPNGIITKGTEVFCRKSGLEYDGYRIPVGKYTIGGIKKWKSKSAYLIGIVSNQPNAVDWGDLDGMVAPGTGLWIDSRYLAQYFDLSISKTMIVKDKFMFRRKNLEGMKCRTVGTLPDNKSSFVEFDENVDGCSADGLGKAGHCVIIPHEYLKLVDKADKKVKSKKLPDDFDDF